MNITTTEEIFDQFVAVGKVAVDTGLDKDYKLENTRASIGKKEWISIKEALIILYNLQDGNYYHDKPINKYIDELKND